MPESINFSLNVITEVWDTQIRVYALGTLIIIIWCLWSVNTWLILFPAVVPVRYSLKGIHCLRCLWFVILSIPAMMVKYWMRIWDTPTYTGSLNFQKAELYHSMHWCSSLYDHQLKHCTLNWNWNAFNVLWTLDLLIWIAAALHWSLSKPNCLT